MNYKTLPERDNIAYLKGLQNYTELHFANGESMLPSYTLLYHQERLDGFLRVSKNHLVNPTFVAKINVLGSTQEVQLKSGKRVKVSRRLRKLVKHIL